MHDDRRGFNLKTISKGQIKCKHPVLADAFVAMGFIKSSLIDLLKIQERCQEYGLPKPEFVEFGSVLRITTYSKLIKVTFRKHSK